MHSHKHVWFIYYIIYIYIYIYIIYIYIYIYIYINIFIIYAPIGSWGSNYWLPLALYNGLLTNSALSSRYSYICRQKKKRDTYTIKSLRLYWVGGVCVAGYLAGIKSAWFRSEFLASHLSRLVDKLNPPLKLHNAKTNCIRNEIKRIHNRSSEEEDFTYTARFKNSHRNKDHPISITRHLNNKTSRKLLSPSITCFLKLPHSVK